MEDHPIKEHEKRFDCIEVNIKELYMKSNVHEVMLTKIQGDLEHVKGRIDNGIAISMRELVTKMDDFIKINAQNSFHIMEQRKDIDDHGFWIGAVKQGFIWVTTIAVGGGLIGLIFHLITKKL